MTERVSDEARKRIEEVLKRLSPLCRQGEDYIWRPVQHACELLCWLLAEPSTLTELIEHRRSAGGEGHIDIVFDGPPGHCSGRFVEVEDAAGKSIRFGQWVERADGHWALRIAPSTSGEGVEAAKRFLAEVNASADGMSTNDLIEWAGKRLEDAQLVCRALLTATAEGERMAEALEYAAAHLDQAASALEKSDRPAAALSARSDAKEARSALTAFKAKGGGK